MHFKRIPTLHPDPEKQGTNIDRIKYDTIRMAILVVLREQDVTTFKELTRAVRDRLENRFEGSVSWYVTTVKLDPEARGPIARATGSSPQRVRQVPDARLEAHRP